MKLRLRALLAALVTLVRARPLPGLLWLVGLAALGTAIDAFTSGEGRFQIFFSLTATFGQFILVSALLRSEGLHHAWAKPGRAASFVGLGIVTGLAILAGLALLLLPGLYLYARWVIATPLVIGEGATISEAMATSWRRTRSAGVAIAMALALINAPFVLGMLLLLLLYPAAGPAALAIACATNTLIAASMIGSWYLAVAVHRLLAEFGDVSATPA